MAKINTEYPSGNSAERDGGCGLLGELGTASRSATRSQKVYTAPLIDRRLVPPLSTPQTLHWFVSLVFEFIPHPKDLTGNWFFEGI